MKVLVLGANGMLGYAVARVLNEHKSIDVTGTVRSEDVVHLMDSSLADKMVFGCDVLQDDSLSDVFHELQPDVVINCISVNKKLLVEADPLILMPIYALLPHRIAKLCDETGVRYIHVSTDGVFSGVKGGYLEEDFPDARDVYGLTKLLGEVCSPNVLNIRTSIIGHELCSKNGLVEWFLSKEKNCSCYSRAIFSGFPTVVLARVIRDVIIPRTDLAGVYHVASEPISKCELLRLIAKVYSKSIIISENNDVVSDRSLIANKFHIETGYTPPGWLEMIQEMYSYKLEGTISDV